MLEQIERLQAAYKILHEKEIEAASGPTPIYLKLHHACQYIDRQISELLEDKNENL